MPSGADAEKNGDVESPDAASGHSKCDEMLANATVLCRPEKVGISVDRAQVSDLFNQWLKECGDATQMPKVGPEAERLLGSILSAEAIAQLGGDHFDGRDVDHIRTCVLMKTITDHVTKSAESDRQRVALLFDYVVRTMALSGETDDPLPLTPFELLLFGRGTAADRAWVFAELLRPLRIDAVILTPQSAWKDGALSAGTPFLLGVLLDESEKPVLLFDPRLGWAVPSPKAPVGKPLDQSAATLAEVIADPSLLAKLIPDDEREYAFGVEFLKSVHVELISDADYNRPRMLLLQSAMPADKSGVYYDPLDNAGESVRGLFPRVVAFGGDRWTAADVSLWPHPERNLSAFEKHDDKQSQRLLVRRHPFDAPADPAVRGAADKPELKFTPRKLQLKTRITQLLGDTPGAIRSYLTVRVERDFEKLVFVEQGQQFDLRQFIPPETVRMHFRAAEDGSFWTAICQYEQGDFPAATQSLADYVRKFPEGEWIDHARGMLARSYTEEGKLAAAIQTLNSISPADPQQDGHRLLQKRIRAQRQKSTDESSEK